MAKSSYKRRGKTKRNSSTRSSPRFETLEDRRLLAIDWSLSGTTLKGDQSLPTAADHVILSQSGGIVVDNVNGTLLNSAGVPINVNAASVTRIEIRTRGGNDIVDFSQLTAADFSALSSTNIDGGRGNDKLTGSWLADGIGGDWGNDTIIGGDGDDFIRAGLGDDHVRGMNGSDTIGGEAGDDTLSGGDGRDFIQGDVGNDRICGDADNDVLNGGYNDDYICGGSGNDEIDGFWGNDTLLGGSGNDEITGGRGRDTIAGGAGTDTIHARNQGKDTIYKDGRDTIHASRRDDERTGSYGSCTDKDATPPPPIHECPADFGDAPDTYGTLLASGGARHEFKSTAPRMGRLIDTEVDGQPSPTAFGDNLIAGATNINDEDGVTFLGGTMHHPLTTKTVMVHVENLPTGIAFVDAWIDFNKNGVFDPSGEQIITSHPVSAGLNMIPYTVPGSVMVGPAITFARFRISSLGGLGPKGLALGGEVEDYAVQVDCDHGNDPNDPKKGTSIPHSGNPGGPLIPDPVSTGGVSSNPGTGGNGNPGTGNPGPGKGYPTPHSCELDFGDAPDSYGTSLPSGAHHEIRAAGPRLGSLIDDETNGQPSALADGDDGSVFDDEDGITFVGGTMHHPNAVKTVMVDVQNIPGFSGAKIDAWIDYNKDGDFLDPFEKVISNQPVTLGLNPLTYTVPSTVMVGPNATYSRFRISTAGNLAPTGKAFDGEVEDYQVFVDCDHEILVPKIGQPQKFDGIQSDPVVGVDDNKDAAMSDTVGDDLFVQPHEVCPDMMEPSPGSEVKNDTVYSDPEELRLISETDREFATDNIFAELGFAT